VFDLEGYSPTENIWQKIMDIKHAHKSNNSNKNRMNMKRTERLVRAKNCFYAPFEQTDQVFITNYHSYTCFKNDQKNVLAQGHY
jgi:hypothetical protein